jgi:hypothetical protein
MKQGVSEHLRRNVYGLVAIFIALGGSAVAANVAKNSVTSKSIKNGQVKTKDLAGGSVDGSKVLADSLTGDQIDEGTLRLPDQGASGAAGGDLTGTYPKPQIAKNAVTAAKILDATLTGADIADTNSLTTAEIDESGLAFSPGGQILGTLGQASLAPGSIGAAEIAENSIGSPQIADNAIGPTELGDNVVGDSEIADNAVGPTKIADNAVGPTEIAANAVGSSEIAGDAVGSSEIAGDAVGSSEIAGDAVGDTEIADDAVGSGEIATGAVAGGEVANRSLTLADISAADTAIGNTSISTVLTDGNCTSVATGLVGAQVGDLVLVVPRSSDPGIFAPPTRVTTAGQFDLTLCNFSGALIVNPSANVDVFALRP